MSKMLQVKYAEARSNINFAPIKFCMLKREVIPLCILYIIKPK